MTQQMQTLSNALISLGYGPVEHVSQDNTRFLGCILDIKRYPSSLESLILDLSTLEIPDVTTYETVDIGTDKLVFWPTYIIS